MASIGVHGGIRASDHDDDRRAVIGISSHVALPFYIYELCLGIRFETTVHRGSISAESVLVDVDVIALIAAVAGAGAMK